MRKSWLVLLVGLSVLVFARTARSGPEVLDTLIDKALKNYPELSAVALTSDAALHSSRAAGALPDPALSLGLLNLPVNSFSLGETPMSGVAVGLTQRVPWPGKLSARSDLANVRYERGKTTVRAVRDRVVREVTDAYLAYSYRAKERLVLEDYIELLRATQQSADTRYAHGEASAQDVLRVGSILSRTEIRLLNTDRMVYSSLLRLWRAVGDSTIFEGLPPYLPEPDSSLLPVESLEANPYIADARLGIEQAEIQKRLARRDYWPDFMLGVDYRVRKNIAGDPVRGTDFLTFKVGLDIPLWFFAKQKHNVRAAERLSLASREQERFVRDMLVARLKDAQFNLETTDKSIREYDQVIVPEAQAALEAARVAYEVGQIDFNALLTAQTDLLDIRLERLNLLKQYHQSVAALKELHSAQYER